MKSRVYNITYLNFMHWEQIDGSGVSATIPIKPVTVCFRAYPSLKPELYTARGSTQSLQVTDATR